MNMKWGNILSLLPIKFNCNIEKNTYSMWSEYIIYISMCFVLFCSYVDSMLVVPMCFLIFRSETFLVLLLTNSHSTRFKPIVNYVKSMMKLNRHYFRFDFIRIEV